MPSKASPDPQKKPGFLLALRLRCPYCGQEPLQAAGSWFEFRGGCPRCLYRFEREEGYFTGASWMINFPVTASLAFLLVVWLLAGGFALSAMQVAILVSVFIFAFGLLFFPFSQALWIVTEHRFRPLSPEDAWQPESKAG